MKKSQTATTGYHDRLRRVEGRHNALVKDLRKAFAHGDLTDDGHCAIEGMRILEEAIRSGLKFRAVFFNSSALAKAERLLPQLAAYVETLLLPDKLFATAVPSDSPQGVAALVRCPVFHRRKTYWLNRPTGPVLAISGVQDPGNLGTILRSAEAFERCGCAARRRHGQSLQLESRACLGWIGVSLADCQSEAGRGPCRRCDRRACGWWRRRLIKARPFTTRN